MSTMNTLIPSPLASVTFRTLALVAFGFGLWTTANAQERELDLRSVFVPEAKVKAYAAAKSGGGELPPLALPFVDDFAWPSFFEDDVATNLKRWEASPVRRTTTLAYQPPTIGCATLDGLDPEGNPYMLNPTNAAGYADTLTSRKLLLASYLGEDSVALSFWYQSGGVANGADAGEDSLIVEFRANVPDGDPWISVWSSEGIDDDTSFHPAVIPIVDGEYFYNEFQFRFRNYGSLEGNVDTWHIDYVRVSPDGTTPAPLEEEIAFVKPPTSALRHPWTAMPWPHFVEDAEGYTATSMPTLHRSFGETSNSQQNIGMKIQRVDVEGNVNSYTPPGATIPNNAVTGLFETDYIQDLQILTPLFNETLSDTFATFHVSLWEDEVGGANGTTQVGVTDNDSIVHVQTFYDYYAYDDGTAEKAYALDGPNGGQGGELVVGYDIQEEDTLDGLWIHFTPFFDDATGATYTLKVYGDDEDNPGQPDTLLAPQFVVHNPNYYANEFDGFTYVPFEAPVPVSGRIYVGFVQQGEQRINVGLDKSTNTNPEYLWYRFFPSLPDWQQSTIEGSLMIRPVLRAGKELVTNVAERPWLAEAPVVFPNPGRTECRWVLEEATEIWVYDLTGREVADLGLLAPGAHTWTTESPGMYLLVGTTRQGQTWSQRWMARP